MKLLQKKDIDLSKARERHLEVQEGKKLAGAVDRLRELRANEEASLDKFREGTVAKVRAQIDDLINTRTALEAEVGTLEVRRANAQKPVDERAAEFSARENLLKKDKVDLAGEATMLREAEEQLRKDRAHVDKLGEFALEAAQDAEKASEEALKDKKAANAALRDAQNVLEEAKKREKQVGEALLARETSVSARERDVKNGYAHLSEQSAALSLRERAIIDREETLLRGIRRMEKEKQQ